MNVHANITNLSDAEMSDAGEVLIPKAIRDRIGLVPGEVQVGINDRGEAVVFPKVQPNRPDETIEQRRARIHAAVESVRGTVDIGFASTDEYMDFIRPHRLDPL